MSTIYKKTVQSCGCIFQFFDHIIKINFPIKSSVISSSKSSAISSSINFNQTQNEIIDFIIEDEQITQKDMARKLDMTDRAVRKAMASLIEKEVIKREGSSRKGKWIIVVKDESQD